MATQLFIAYFKALDNSQLAGPVTKDGDEYLFVNKNSSADIYFKLKKSFQGWHFAGGPTTYTVPQRFIDDVGAQIDQHFQEQAEQR
jgi:hypothetical protein